MPELVCSQWPLSAIPTKRLKYPKSAMLMQSEHTKTFVNVGYFQFNQSSHSFQLLSPTKRSDALGLHRISFPESVIDE